MLLKKLKYALLTGVAAVALLSSSYVSPVSATSVQEELENVFAYSQLSVQAYRTDMVKPLDVYEFRDYLKKKIALNDVADLGTIVTFKHTSGHKVEITDADKFRPVFKELMTEAADKWARLIISGIAILSDATYKETNPDDFDQLVLTNLSQFNGKTKQKSKDFVGKKKVWNPFIGKSIGLRIENELGEEEAFFPLCDTIVQHIMQGTITSADGKLTVPGKVVFKSYLKMAWDAFHDTFEEKSGLYKAQMEFIKEQKDGSIQVKTKASIGEEALRKLAPLKVVVKPEDSSFILSVPTSGGIAEFKKPKDVTKELDEAVDEFEKIEQESETHKKRSEQLEQELILEKAKPTSRWGTFTVPKSGTMVSSQGFSFIYNGSSIIVFSSFGVYPWNISIDGPLPPLS